VNIRRFLEIALTLTAMTAMTAATAVTACAPAASGSLSETDRGVIADSIRKLVTATYDLSQPNAVARLMSLYPQTGPVYSTSSGQVTKTRADLQRQIDTFWRYVGSNMRKPEWEWTSMQIDVLSRDAAVMTASYRVPHLTPRNTPHVIAGAWTAVFVNRGGRWVVIQEHLSDVPASALDSLPAQSSEHAGH